MRQLIDKQGKRLSIFFEHRFNRCCPLRQNPKKSKKTGENCLKLSNIQTKLHFVKITALVQHFLMKPDHVWKWDGQSI
jgi:hypothetical protein